MPRDSTQTLRNAMESVDTGGGSEGGSFPVGYSAAFHFMAEYRPTIATRQGRTGGRMNLSLRPACESLDAELPAL